MGKTYTVYNESVHGKQIIIKCVENDNGNKRKYYIFESLPESLQHNQEFLLKVKEEIQQQSIGTAKQKELVCLDGQNNEKHWFIREEATFLQAFKRAYQVDREIKKENKILDKINGTSGVICSGCKFYKKPSEKIKVALIALGVSMAVLIGSGAGLASIVNIDEVQSNIGVVETVKGNEKEQAPEIYFDLSKIDYSTHQNTRGDTLLELVDAIRIADACFNNLRIELKNASHSYHYDATKFRSTMYAGEQMRESSLKITKEDINDDYRGPFQMGSDAIEEANEVSLKLTGKKIIETVDDLYDPVKSCMACMYFSVKNYEYCYDIVGDKVTPSMVFDTYLHGCLNVRSWLRKDVEMGTDYEAQSYSKDVLYYDECFEYYKNALDNGLTDGSHDQYWEDTYYNKVWKLPKWDTIENKQSQLGD